MNKKLILSIITVGLNFFTVQTFSQSLGDSSGCPLPISTANGYRMPPYSDMMQQRSPDGKVLVFEEEQDAGAAVLDLSTLKRTEIKVSGGLPKEQVIGLEEILFCPYDPDLIIIHADELVDGDSSGLADTYVQNLFTYRISTNESSIIMPMQIAPYGKESVVGNWTKFSQPDRDTFLIGYQDGGPWINGYYVPATGEWLPVPPKPINYTRTLATSGSHRIWDRWDSTTGHPLLPYYLDSTELNLSLDTSTISPLRKASFSPDGKLIAFWVFPQGFCCDSNILEQVWVSAVADPSTVISKINFRNLFCTYDMWGFWSEFITDSTIAVSMHHDGDESSPLWEITIDGRIIRQLTFLPEYPSGIDETPSYGRNLHVFPNPATNELQILGGPAGTVRLFDLLGRVRAEARNDGAGVTLNISHLEPGAYVLRIGTQSAKVEIAR